MSTDLPSTTEAKAQAKALRTELSARGTEIGHSQALELVAYQHGYRDWNTLHAAIGNRPPAAWTPGSRVEGTYLSQPFTATVTTAEEVRPGWFRLGLELDEPVDVVTFDSFSNIRSRLHATIGPQGVSREVTSNGEPHLKLKL